MSGASASAVRMARQATRAQAATWHESGVAASKARLRPNFVRCGTQRAIFFCHKGGFRATMTAEGDEASEVSERAIESDEALVAAAKAGDRGAFGHLVKRYQDLVCAIAYSRVGDAESAQDVAQEAFLASFEGLSGLRVPSKYRAWLTRITRTLCDGWHRSERYRRALRERLGDLGRPETTAAPEEILEAKEDGAMLSRAMARLPATMREALVLYYFQGESYRETARSLGISQSALRKRLERAKKRMRECLTLEAEGKLRKARPARDFPDRTVAAVAGGSICRKMGLNAAGIRVGGPLRELTEAARHASTFLVGGGMALTAKKVIVMSVVLGLAAAGTGYLAIRHRRGVEQAYSVTRAPGRGMRVTEEGAASTGVGPAGLATEGSGRGSADVRRVEAEWLIGEVDKWDPGWSKRIPVEFLKDPTNAFNHYLLAAVLMVSGDLDPRSAKAESLLWTSEWDWNNPDHLAVAEAYLEANGEALAELRAAIETDYYQAPPLLDFSVPLYLGKFRKLANLLSVELGLLKVSGDTAGAIRGCFALLEMGYDVGSQALNYIDTPSRCGMAFSARGSYHMPELLSQTRDVEVCLEAVTRLHELGGRKIDACAMMRAQLELWVKSVYDPQLLEQLEQSAGSMGYPFPPPEVLMGLSKMAQNESEREMAYVQSVAGRRLDAMNRSFSEFLSMPALESDQGSLGGQLAEEFEKLARNLVKNAARQEVRRAANEALAGLKLYQLQTGDFPQSLAELVPDYLPEIPVDPYSGGPLKYLRVGEGVMVYSVGPDLKDDRAEKRATNIWGEGDTVFELR